MSDNPTFSELEADFLNTLSSESSTESTEPTEEVNTEDPEPTAPEETSDNTEETQETEKEETQEEVVADEEVVPKDDATKTRLRKEKKELSDRVAQYEARNRELEGQIAEYNRLSNEGRIVVRKQFEEQMVAGLRQAASQDPINLMRELGVEPQDIIEAAVSADAGTYQPQQVMEDPRVAELQKTVETLKSQLEQTSQATSRQIVNQVENQIRSDISTAVSEETYPTLHMLNTTTGHPVAPDGLFPVVVGYMNYCTQNGIAFTMPQLFAQIEHDAANRIQQMSGFFAPQTTTPEPEVEVPTKPRRSGTIKQQGSHSSKSQSNMTYEELEADFLRTLSSQ